MGKQEFLKFADQVMDVVDLGLTKQPTVIDVYVLAPQITVKAAEVSMSPQVKVNVPEVLGPDVEVVMPPSAERQITVAHSDGTESVVNVSRGVATSLR
jgi:hypothetical protein